jgi:hypothetical protein
MGDSADVEAEVNSSRVITARQRKSKLKKLVMNISDTKYSVIKAVAR